MKNNRKKFYVSIGVILSVMALVTIFAFRQEAQTNNSNKANQQEQDDPPTPIQLGVMNEKQRKNSKRYSRSNEVPSLISEDRDVLRGIGESIISDESPENIPLQEVYFRNPTCQSDAIIIGKVRNKSSQLSEDTKSIFTDYDLEIFDIIKNTSPLTIRPNNIITITRSGGIVKFNNRKIEVVNASYKRLKIGKDYIFFLSYLSDSESFAPSTVEGTFEIQGNKIKRLRANNPPYQNSKEDLQGFLNIIRGIAQTCPQQGGE